MQKNDFDLIVFCHLRWEFVTQRPQHIMNRIARDHKILFVEEPIGDKPDGSANVIRASENITVIQPRIPSANYATEIIPILEQQIKKLGLQTPPVLWFYSGSFYGVLEHFKQRRLVIYDCMDELSGFLGAPKELIDDEKKLLAAADIVFTGGRSLYESKSRIHKNVFCFPSSVDQKHFEQALSPATTVADDIAKIRKPIVGYYGVIDERIDLKLIAETAELLPEVSFVMIGPVVKISDKDLPKRENLYYLGSKNYADLPKYLKAFDIAMMPFAINAATKFISPTKTLEYMAAKKPIISTPIFDVVRTFSKEVSIAADSGAFMSQINTFLKEDEAAKTKREQAQTQFLTQTSWDATVEKMLAIINRELGKELNKTRIWQRIK